MVLIIPYSKALTDPFSFLMDWALYSIFTTRPNLVWSLALNS